MSGPDVTRGHLLGGLIHHAQRQDGHRTGIEPVLLAASIPAKPDQRVLEAGTGSGAALLCLAARVPGIRGIGVERDAITATVARANVVANGFDALDIVTAAIETFQWDEPFDHAFANPPWHEARGTRSPDSAQEAARRADPELIERWIGCLAAALRFRGTLSVIASVEALPAILKATQTHDCGSPAIFPFWPRQGIAAKLLLLRIVRGGKAPCRVLPGLALHGDGHAYSAEADHILRGGGSLDL